MDPVFMKEWQDFSSKFQADYIKYKTGDKKDGLEIGPTKEGLLPY